MKLTTTTFLIATCCGARLAVASTAHIYTYNPPRALPPTGKATNLSPVAARLVLAQRAGVEEYHSADLDNSEVIQAINTFGKQTPLFGEQQYEAEKVFISLQTTSTDPPPLLADYLAFTIHPAPAPEGSKRLFADLAHQSDPTAFLDQPFGTHAGFKVQLRNGNAFWVLNSTAELEQHFRALVDEGMVAITAIVTPSDGSDTSSWGTYEVPNAEAPLKKREQSRQEAPLEDSSTSFIPVDASSLSYSSLADSGPLPGILPACFPSQSACESTTRNCTGHGRCVKKFTDKDAADTSPAKNCYSCQCAATRTTNADGQTQTWHWGGPACQKQDISVQFWLLALFTVAMVFLVAFAVGEIRGMGDEELPSVIGAGVSGPTAKR